MSTALGMDVLVVRLINAASVQSDEDRAAIRLMLELLPLTDLEKLAERCSGHSDESWCFVARMAICAHKREGLTVATDSTDFLIFAAEIAPVAINFEEMSAYSVDRWLYMSTVISKQRGNAVSPDDLFSYHLGLALTLFVDKLSVSGHPEASNMVWLGANWNALEPFVPVLVERSSVERSFVESLIDGTNGLLTMSKGIL